MRSEGTIKANKKADGFKNSAAVVSGNQTTQTQTTNKEYCLGVLSRVSLKRAEKKII